MISIEIKLLKSKQQVLPVAILIFALFFMAFVDFWIGTKQSQLAGAELAAFISIRANQSTLSALFFIFWVLQRTTHLINPGYYKMLLTIGWPRHKLFIYNIFQVVFHSSIFMLLNFICYAALSIFNDTNPLQLIFHTDYNSIFSQFLYLAITGFVAITISFLRPNSVMALPILVYWILESWLVGFIQRKLESNAGHFFPFQAMKQIISENLLGTQQIIFIAGYTLLFLLVLHFSIQKRMFV
jgi:hypothetical protein